MKNKANKKKDNHSSIDEILNDGLTAPQTLEQLLNEFAASKKNIDQGLLADLKLTTENFIRLMENGYVFSLTDFVIASGALDLNTQVLQNWFEDFTAFMENKKRVRVTEITDSCYTYKTFHFVR